MPEVQTNNKLSEGQKLKKLHNVEASVNGLKADMDKLTTTLKSEGEEEKESILLGVLMSRKSKSEKQKTSRLVKILKRRQRKENREYLKEHGMMSKNAEAMKTAIEAVKKGDMAQLTKMQGVLQQSMKAMQGNQDFLVFLSLQAWTDHSKACPYCKAQCLEKCHNGGNSFMKCMTECEDVGN